MPEHTPAPTPSRAVYGFVMYLSFKTFFIIYLIWAILPEKWFEIIGIMDMPHRYWSVSIPIFLLTILTTFAFVIYPSLGLCMTPNIDDIRTIKEVKNTQPIKKGLESVLHYSSCKEQECCKNKNTCGKKDYDKVKDDFILKSIPPLQDLDILKVSEHLYLK